MANLNPKRKVLVFPALLTTPQQNKMKNVVYKVAEKVSKSNDNY